MIFLSKFFCSKEVSDRLRILYPAASLKVKEREYFLKKIKFLVQIILTGTFLAVLIYFLSDSKKEITDDIFLPREDYGGNSKSYQLKALGEEVYEIEVEVTPREYTHAQLEELFMKAIEQLPQIIMGNNTELSCIHEDMVLVAQVQDFPFEIVWATDRYDYIGRDGRLKKEVEENENVVVTLIAKFSYQDFEREYSFPVVLVSETKSMEENRRISVQEEVERMNEKTKYNSFMELPTEINGNQVTWKERKGSGGLTVLALTVFLGIAVYVLKDNDLKKEVEKRNQQLLTEYPIIISRMNLYLSAGLTTKGAFQKIAFDYRNRKRSNINYAYEEMLIACHEMQGGMSEANAYERFGKRCNLQPYLKMATLFVQNLKKGNRELLHQLQQEAAVAQETRKNLARKKGEEAGTKLLMPMMLMLVIVMVMIMVPAFLSF